MYSRLTRNRAVIGRGLLPARKWLLFLLAILLVSHLKLSAQGNGIGGYDLRSPGDLAVSFDYDGVGLSDHLIIYRPGTGTVFILAVQGNGVNIPVFTSGSGIGGYDLMSRNDRILPFDYNGSGFADHLVCYRPGSGIVWILQNVGGVFSPVYQSAAGAGIGGYDFASANDRLVAFDYDGSGLNDHLLAYRPGTGTVFIIANSSGSFSHVFTSASGIGGWPLNQTTDILVPLDYYSVGSADHLVAYTPGTGMVSIVENHNGEFSSVFTSTSGIGGYDLKSPADRLISYDYDGNGNRDHLIAYRPGSGIFWILGSAYLSYTAVYSNSANGVGGFDLMSSADRITTMNYLGASGSLFIYRPGFGLAFIETHSGTNYVPVFSSAYNPGFLPGLNRGAIGQRF